MPSGLKPLIVGEAPGRRPGPALLPLPGTSGGRLALILRMTSAEYLEAFDRTNLFDTPGAWDAARAAARAVGVCARVMKEDRVLILLGRRVAEAFGRRYEPFVLSWRWHGAAVVLPHPSGRCRAWNDPRAARRARKVIRGILARGGRA